MTVKNPDITMLAPMREPATARLGWRGTGLVFAVALLALLTANRETLQSWVGLWIHAGHESSFVILAASAWLVWRARERLSAMIPRADWTGLLLLVPLAAAQWVAHAVDVQVVQTALFVCSLGALVWTVFGRDVLRRVAFAIGFLFLAVPIWLHLEPLLQDLTVHVVALALRLTGTPVYVDETYIHVPDRTLVVLGRCSGVQFFHAGLTIGALSAYLNFSMLRTRLATFAAFVVVSIVGNWVRVYALAFMGVLSGPQHFAFGWLVFALAVAPAVWLSVRLQRYEDRQTPAAAVPADPARTERSVPPLGVAPMLMIGAAATLLVSIGPLLAAHAVAPAEGMRDGDIPVVAHAPWSGPYPVGNVWRPAFARADKEALGTFRADGREVAMYWAYYARQTQGAEVINELNAVYDEAQWQLRGGYVGTDVRTLSVGGRSLSVIETRLENQHTGRSRLVWHWYRIAGHDVVQPWRAKLAQVTGLLRHRSDAIVIAVSVDERSLEDGRAQLEEFLVANVVPGIVP